MMGAVLLIPIGVTAKVRHRRLAPAWKALSADDRSEAVLSSPDDGSYREIEAGMLLYGGFWRRLGAYVLDVCTLMGASWIGYALLAMISYEAPELVTRLGGWALGFAYYTLFESSPLSATVGKMVVGLRVVDLTGRRISVARAFGRTFGKILSTLIFFAGFIMIGVTERRQGLHDMLADCLVIRPSPSPQPAAGLPTSDPPGGSPTDSWS
jgi:uncharacterized RDD family membrane protein YckC